MIYLEIMRQANEFARIKVKDSEGMELSLLEAADEISETINGDLETDFFNWLNENYSSGEVFGIMQGYGAGLIRAEYLLDMCTDIDAGIMPIENYGYSWIC